MRKFVTDRFKEMAISELLDEVARNGSGNALVRVLIEKEISSRIRLHRDEKGAQ